MQHTQQTQQHNQIGRPPLISRSEQQRWKDTYGIDDPNHRAILYINNIIQDGIINQQHELAGYLLFQSCQSRINACHYATGIYAHVSCDWDEPTAMWMDIYNQLPRMWDEWIRLTDEHRKADYANPARPTIDRIDEARGYTLDNIQALSTSDNATKAARRAQYLIDISTNKYRRFDTKQAALDAIGAKVNSDTGGIIYVDGKQYLLQSEALTLGKKEFAEKDSDDSPDTKEYETVLPMFKATLDDGREIILGAKITYQQMSIKLNT